MYLVGGEGEGWMRMQFFLLKMFRHQFLLFHQKENKNRIIAQVDTNFQQLLKVGRVFLISVPSTLILKCYKRKKDHTSGFCRSHSFSHGDHPTSAYHRQEQCRHQRSKSIGWILEARYIVCGGVCYVNGTLKQRFPNVIISA